MIDLTKFDINANDEYKPVYSKRYKKNGEEYLVETDKINIVEDMAEKQLEIERIKEIYNNQERLKAEELIDNLTDEEYIANLEELELKNQELDTYEFLNKMEDIKEVYNMMPEDIRIKYKNLAEFQKEFLPKFIEERKNYINELKQEEIKEQQAKIKEQENISKKLQEQAKMLEELQAKMKGEENV